MHKIYKDYDPNMKLTDEEKHGIDYIYGELRGLPSRFYS